MKHPVKDARAALEAALAPFKGKHADDVAKMVVKFGVKGRSGSTTACPAAAMLHGAHGGQFIVGRKFVAKRTVNGPVKVPTPPALSAFIQRFDRGEYPHLMLPPPRCQAGARAKKAEAAKGARVKPWRSGPSGPSGKKAKRGPLVNRPALEVGRFA